MAEWWQMELLVVQTVKNFSAMQRHRFDPWIRKILWRSKWQPIPVFLLGKFHGWRSLIGYSPWVAKSRTQLSNFTGSLEEETGYAQLPCYLCLFLRDLPVIEDPVFCSDSMICMLKYWGEKIR